MGILGLGIWDRELEIWNWEFSSANNRRTLPDQQNITLIIKPFPIRIAETDLVNIIIR